jgi:FHS family L-fucose permease-like MFS transporter
VCSKKAGFRQSGEPAGETPRIPGQQILGSGPGTRLGWAEQEALTGQINKRKRGATNMATQTTPKAAASAPNYTGPFITVTALFFIFGFITNLNMALVPHLRNIFNLPYGWAMLAESAFFLAYFVFSSPTGKLIEMIGYKRTMVVSLFIQVVGCLLFVPAAKMVSFPLFLTAVFVVGAGVTACRPRRTRMWRFWGRRVARRCGLTLAQAFNSIGGTIAPLVRRRLHPDRSGQA